jgi:hypothetical protein
MLFGHLPSNITTVRVTLPNDLRRTCACAFVSDTAAAPTVRLYRARTQVFASALHEKTYLYWGFPINPRRG